MPSTVAAVTTFLKTVGLAIGGLSISGGTALAIGAATVVAGAVVAKKLIDNIYGVPSLDGDRSRQATVRGTVEPQKLIYGKALVSGPISFVGVAGEENRDLYHVIVLAGHPCTAITDIHFDDMVIANGAIDSSGNVTSGTFGPQDGTTICVIRKKLGDQTVADSVLDNAFGTINQAEHIGTNLTYIVTKFTLTDESQEIWDKYLPQDIKALVSGKKIYDPRQDSTSTHYDSDVGVSTQRANTSATWEYSDNPVWCLVDYMRDDTFGMNISIDKIDLAKAVTAANQCDASVSIPNGSEKRFTCNGVLFGTVSHKANINKLLSSMNGMLTYTNGKFVIRAGAFEAVGTGLELTDDHLTGAVKLKTSFERNERFNTITGTFIDPTNNYKEIEFPRVQITSALARDNNEELREEVKLNMTNSFYMAQRISHKLIQQSDLQKVLTFPTNLAGINIAVGDRVSVTLSEFNYTNKTFVCLGWNLSESGSGGVNLILREDDSASYADMSIANYSTVTPSGGIQEGFFGVPDPSGLSATALVEGIELDWTNPVNMTHVIAIEVFASPDSAWANAVKIGETIGTQFIHDASNGVDSIADGDERYYWVRARRFPTGEGTDAVSDRNPDSDTSTVNATRGALGALAGQDEVGVGQIADDAVGSGQIADDAVGSDQIADSAVTLAAFASDINPVQVVSSLPSTANQGDMAFLTTDNNLYRYDGTAWTRAIALGDVTGAGDLAALDTVGSSQIDDDAITNAQIAVDAIQGDVIAAGAITETMIGADAVTTAAIANDAITSDLIAAGAITSTEIGANAVTTAAIANDAITTDLIAAGAITSTEIGADAVTTSAIAANAITATEIAAGAVTANEIAANTITAGQIAAGAVTATEIAANTITSSQIAANTVTASEIAAGAVTANEIAANTITAGQIAAGAVSATEIAANTITSSQIAANAITASEIAAGAITATEIAAGTITSSELAADSVTANAIAAGSVAADEIAAGAVTTAKLDAGAVTANEIAANTITAGQIAAGAISATEISVSELSAISGDLGTLTAGTIDADVVTINNLSVGTAEIDDLAVSTLKIADNAVTIPESATGSTHSTIGSSSSPTVLLTKTITYEATAIPSAVLVTGFAVVKADQSQVGYIRVVLEVAGVDVFTTTDTSIYTTTETKTFVHRVTGLTGTSTQFKLKVYRTGSSSNANVYQSGIIILGAKK